MGSMTVDALFTRSELNELKAKLAQESGRVSYYSERDLVRAAHERAVRDSPGRRSYGGLETIVEYAERIFATGREAHDYIVSKDGYTGDAYAVRVLPQSPAEPPEVAKLRERVTAASKTLREIGPAAIARCKAVKSKTRGCAKCGSSIAVTHISRTNCPVCGDADFVFTAAEVARVASLTGKIEEWRQEEQRVIAAAHSAAVTKAKPEECNWMIGGWVKD